MNQRSTRNVSTTKQKVCRYWKSGKSCRFGTQCRFLHSYPVHHCTAVKNNNGTETGDDAFLTLPRDLLRSMPALEFNLQGGGGGAKSSKRNGTRDKKRNSQMGKANRNKNSKGTKVHRYSSTAFHDFFVEGSVGHTLLKDEQGIRSYLTVRDLLNLGAAGRQVHGICRTYTVHEILTDQGIEMSRSRRIQLGTLMMNALEDSPYGSKSTRPKRLIIASSHESFWAMLYHPRELPRMNRVIERFFSPGLDRRRTLLPVRSGEDVATTTIEESRRKEMPTLLYAKFHTADVTSIVERNIKTNKGMLILSPPPAAKTSQGRRAHMPTTFRYWYTRIFGDPAPGVPKKLKLCVRDADSRKMRIIPYEENVPVRMWLNIQSHP